MSEQRCFNPFPASAEDWLLIAAKQNPNAGDRGCGRHIPNNLLKICEIGGICGSNFGIWAKIVPRFSLTNRRRFTPTRPFAHTPPPSPRSTSDPRHSFRLFPRQPGITSLWISDVFH